MNRKEWSRGHSLIMIERIIRHMENNKCIVLGGSFNPPTIAHERLMQHAMEQTGAAYGVFVPSSHNYVARKMSRAHPGANLLFSEHARLEMLYAITSHDPCLFVSDNEYGDDGRGHTFKTMKYLQKTHPYKEYYFLLGADKLKVLPRWGNIEKFLENFQFIVTSRSEDNAMTLISNDPILNRHIERFVIIPELEGMEDISSTHARVLLKSGDFKNAAKLLNSSVLHICKNAMRLERK